jgi:formate/nitrite transporter FocA (FNT family)
MSDHLLSWLAGLIVGVATAVAVSIATRFQLLPEVVDPSFVLTGAGIGGLGGAAYAAMRRFPPDRLGRVVLLGNLVGAALFAALFLLGLAGVSL